MGRIFYLDRITGTREEEHIYGGAALRFLYGTSLFSRLFGHPLAFLVARVPLFSAFYGWWQSRSFTRRKIVPFIDRYNVDTKEFLKPVAAFSSFNDFFIRKLKPEARPFASGKNQAIIPADGRYLFYPQIDRADGFVVKGKRFDLASLLQNEDLAARYAQGSMVMARLCPVDYHRFHFPSDGIAEPTQCLNGWLYSVNPLALRQNISIFTENKRTLCHFHTDSFGDVLLMEVGATHVGSIVQTYSPGKKVSKGEEKGFFSFGASALILLFPPEKIQFDTDLLAASQNHLEIRCLMGQPMGTAAPM